MSLRVPTVLTLALPLSLLPAQATNLDGLSASEGMRITICP